MGEAKRKRDYPQMARAAAAAQLFADLKRIGPADFIPYGDDGGADMSRISDRTAVFLTIGARGDLTESMAKGAAGAFLKIKKRAGAGMVILSLSGWNDDPREIWDIPEAAEYVRLWVLQWPLLGDVSKPALCGLEGRQRRPRNLLLISSSSSSPALYLCTL